MDILPISHIMQGLNYPTFRVLYPTIPLLEVKTLDRSLFPLAVVKSLARSGEKLTTEKSSCSTLDCSCSSILSLSRLS